MALRDELKSLEIFIRSNKAYRNTNHELIDIYDGNLEVYLEAKIRNLFGVESFKELQKLLVPINILQKIIDKLSKIYQQKVSRHVLEGTDADSELLVWYEDNFKVNQTMNIANELFNLTKATLIEPYLNKGKPQLRVIPNDRFIVFSDDLVDPTNPTHVTVILDEKEDKSTFITWTANEVLIWDSDFKIRADLMAQMFAGTIAAEGINPYGGKIPYIYGQAAHNLLIPKHDTDMLSLTLEIPAQISFLNYAIAYQAFSIVFGIDVDDENLVRAPNAFWSIKSDPTSDKKPEIGVIKPQVDITEALGFIEAEIAFWLSTKGIKAGSLGKLSSDNMASGIAKMIDEMDTVEARKKQIDYFENIEMDLWDLVLNHMQPYWVATGMVENRTIFTPTATVNTVFTEPTPFQTRGEIIEVLKLEMEAGFTSRKRALKKLHPDFTEQEIDTLIQEIDDERTLETNQTEETEEKGEETQKETGETSINDGHKHNFSIDSSGNGSTGVTNGHRHAIIDGVVQREAGHVHKIIREG